MDPKNQSWGRSGLPELSFHRIRSGEVGEVVQRFGLE